MASNDLDQGFKEVPLDEGFEEVKSPELDKGFEEAASGVAPASAKSPENDLLAKYKDFIDPKSGKLDMDKLLKKRIKPGEEEPVPSYDLGDALSDISKGVDKYTGRPTRAAALAAMTPGASMAQAAKESITQDKDVTGQEVAHQFLKRSEEAGLPLRAPGMEEFPAEKPLGVAADLALNPLNIGLAPEEAGMMASKGVQGVKNMLIKPAGEAVKAISELAPRPMQEGFQAGKEGVNLFSDVAKTKIMPEESYTAADKLTNKMLQARADLGKEAGKVLEKATAEGTTVDAEPAFKKLDQDFESLASKDSSYADETSESGKLSTKLLSRIKQYENIDSLSPVEANNLRDEIYEASRNVKAKDPYLARMGFDFADNISVLLKAQLPAYEDAASRYDQFSKLLPETILSKGEEAKATNIKLKQLDNPYLELKDATNEVVSGYARPGTSFDDSKRTVNRLEQSLSDLVDFEKQRQTAAEVEGKPFQSVFDKMGMNKDQIIEYIKKKSQRVAAYDLARGGSATVPLKIPRSVGGTMADMARGGGVYVGNIGGMIYNAPNEVLAAVSEKLKSAPEVAHLGQALSDALKSNDNIKRNAALFAIMQNPKAKYLIDPSLKDSQNQGEAKTSKGKYDNYSF